ncbi:cytochrome P450 [Mycena rosella]|uniref:Cytochrome P450 n=1 Tax=Mycena rosella TaxID=1033263 RepID=A0AAD7DH72_MYCRO|nr:cytochrome P450 [Mycena rosella]
MSSRLVAHSCPRKGKCVSPPYYQELCMCSAGEDTLTALLLALLANPEAQRKAQAEIDKVMGTGHLPDFGEEAMSYVPELVKELRWIVTARNDDYHGYRIPAGLIFIGNVWAILHDETMYADPFAFKPERYLLDGKPNPDMPDPQIALGFGRRFVFALFPCILQTTRRHPDRPTPPSCLQINPVSVCGREYARTHHVVEHLAVCVRAGAVPLMLRLYAIHALLLSIPSARATDDAALPLPLPMALC